LIPDGRLCEMSFEALKADPVTELRRVYETLHLPAFQHCEPTLRDYLSTVQGYEQNRLSTLPAHVREQIAREWSKCFETWGYSTACHVQETGHG
jgi:hypothetical protein